MGVAKSDIERDKLTFDIRKHEELLVLERQRLQQQERQAVLTWMSTIVPLIVGLGTLIVGILSLREQSRLQFELKAAEIMFDAPTPEAMARRGRFLKNLFNHRLPEHFLVEFKTERKEPSNQKLMLLDYLLKYYGQRNEVLELWGRLFPGDYDWLSRAKGDTSPGAESGKAKPS